MIIGPQTTTATTAAEPLTAPRAGFMVAADEGRDVWTKA